MSVANLSLTLAGLVQIRQSGTRSINVEYDIRQSDIGNSYVMTGLAQQSLLRILERSSGQGAARAWTLTGPYGTGKSYFALFLMNLLSKSLPSHATTLQRLQAANPMLAELAATIAQPGSQQGLLPVPITGYRTSIQHCIAEGLRHALSSLDESVPIRNLLNDNPLWAVGEDSRAVIRIVRETLRVVTSAEVGYSGMVIILDEMGKPLEHAAAHPNSSDLFLLQELAESANRSGDTTLLLIGILHQSFDRYAGYVDSVGQSEWAKIQGRFQDLAFQEPPNQQLWLLANALEYTVDRETLARAWPDAHATAMEAVARNLLPTGLKPDDFLELCERTLPFHPSAMAALPFVFRRLAQNERSMFAYLASMEPRGFQEFLAEHWAPDRIRLADLFDYIAANLQGRLYSTLRARPLTEALGKLESDVDLSAEAVETIKTISMLNWLSEIGPFKATTDTILYAMRSASRTDEAIQAVLEDLRKRSAIVFRRFNQSWVIWQGSDVDIDERISEARQRQLSGFDTAVAAQKYAQPQPIVARRHSYQTGTTRFFDVRYVSSPDQITAADAPESGASGTVHLCLSASTVDADAFARQAQSGEIGQHPNVVIGVLTRTPRLVEVLKEMHCLHWVHDNTPELRDDPVARREVRTRLNEMETLVRNELDSGLRVNALQNENACRWYHRGKEQDAHVQRGLSQWLSTLCDDLYASSPIVRNEILNRRQLSSQGAAARRNLIEAMLLRAHLPILGIEGYPPERSMYESLLRTGRLHSESAEGGWSFQAPAGDDPLRLTPVWQAMSDYVFAPPPQPRSVQELFALLTQPPFGITDGVLPVLLCAFLLVHQQETTLYSEGTLLPLPDVADWEVLLRRPELFAVAGCRIVGPRLVVVERLARGLRTEPAAMPIVRELIRQIKSLPEHVLRTQRLSATTLHVRRAIEAARSPESLLFHDLPQAVGVEPFGELADPDAGQVDRFFGGLNGALQELAGVMPRVLADARDQLLKACGLPAGDEGWQQFMQMAGELWPKVSQPTLTTLLRRASDAPDTRVALESTLAYVVNRPARSWSDNDREQFVAKAQSYGELFRRERNGYITSAVLTPGQKERSSRLAAELRERLQSDLSTDALAVRAALQTLLEEFQSSPEYKNTEGTNSYDRC